MDSGVPKWRWFWPPKKTSCHLIIRYHVGKKKQKQHLGLISLKHFEIKSVENYKKSVLVLKKRTSLDDRISHGPDFRISLGYAIV